MKPLSDRALSSTILSHPCHPERSESLAKRVIRGVEGILHCFAALKATFTAILREIFDESAYDRFLRYRGLQPSAASYANFRAEHEHAKSVRPRCC
jgi:hypothetical protein